MASMENGSLSSFKAVHIKREPGTEPLFTYKKAPTSHPISKSSLSTPAQIKSESSDAPSSSQGNSQPPKLYHTLTACTRCRSRKTRCDAGLPRCGPCERSGSHCEFFDSTKQKTIPRNYVLVLQAKVRQLETEYARRIAELSEVRESDEEELVKSIGMVSLDDKQKMEPRFVGSASGINMTRLVLDYTKKNLEPEAVREIAEEHKANMSAADEAATEFNLNAKAANRFPPRAVTDRLVEAYLQKAQLLLPIVHEPTLLQYVEDIYSGDQNPFKIFQLRMVLAVALTRMNNKAAEGYYLSAYEQLETILEPMDMMTLQCLALLCQYSILTPTRIAVYHVLGIAVRLCIQLGYSQEKTITLSDTPLDPLTEDMRRRLFWVFASFEYGVSHVLGRPSGFSTIDAYIDVEFYSDVPDQNISREGIIPGPPCPKKLVSMHFFRLRRLQAQIRQTLYQNKRPTPADDKDPWFKEMDEKILNWLKSAPTEMGALTKDWFKSRYHNMIIFMYRPSPQIPKPSIEATFKCYDVAVQNVYIQEKMHRTGSVDITFVFVYQVTIALMAIIWAICTEQIRETYPESDVRKHIQTSLAVLSAASVKWPGTAATVDIFRQLSKAALKLYQKDERARSEKSNSLSPGPVSSSLPPPVSAPARHSTPPNPLLSSESTPFSSQPQQAPPLPPPLPHSMNETSIPNQARQATPRSSTSPRSYPQQSVYDQPYSQFEAHSPSQSLDSSAASLFSTSPQLNHPPHSLPPHSQSSYYYATPSPAASTPSDLTSLFVESTGMPNIAQLFSPNTDVFSWDPTQFFAPETPSTGAPGSMPLHSPAMTTSSEYAAVNNQYHQNMVPLDVNSEEFLGQDVQVEELRSILDQERMLAYQQQQQQQQMSGIQVGGDGVYRGVFFG